LYHNQSILIKPASTGFTGGGFPFAPVETIAVKSQKIMAKVCNEKEAVTY